MRRSPSTASTCTSNEIHVRKFITANSTFGDNNRKCRISYAVAVAKWELVVLLVPTWIIFIYFSSLILFFSAPVNNFIECFLGGELNNGLARWHHWFVINQIRKCERLLHIHTSVWSVCAAAQVICRLGSGYLTTSRTRPHNRIVFYYFERFRTKRRNKKLGPDVDEKSNFRILNKEIVSIFFLLNKNKMDGIASAASTLILIMCDTRGGDRRSALKFRIIMCVWGKLRAYGVPMKVFINQFPKRNKVDWRRVY